MSDLLTKSLTHYDPLRRGFTRTGLANAMRLTRGRFWSRIAGGYNLRRAIGRRPTSDDPVVGAAGSDAVSIVNFTWQSHGPSTTYTYRLNAVGPGGVEEVGETNRAHVAFDAGGALIGLRPNAPTNLRVSLESGGRFRLAWTYSEADEEVSPTEFRVFNDNGTGTVDYGTVVATLTARARKFHYDWLSSAFADGATRIWAVRAASAGGVEDANINVVTGTADAAGPPVHGTASATCGTETL